MNRRAIARQQLVDERLRRRQNLAGLRIQAAASIQHHRDRRRLQIVREGDDVAALAVVEELEILLRQPAHELTVIVAHGGIHGDGFHRGAKLAAAVAQPRVKRLRRLPTRLRRQVSSLYWQHNGSEPVRRRVVHHDLGGAGRRRHRHFLVEHEARRQEPLILLVGQFQVHGIPRAGRRARCGCWPPALRRRWSRRASRFLPSG